MSDKEKILDIAMNLNRIGNWAADDYSKKRKRIVIFLDHTSDNLESLDKSTLPKALKRPLEKFLKDYPRLMKDGKNTPSDELAWAETMMTWGNILTHRAQLIQT